MSARITRFSVSSPTQWKEELMSSEGASSVTEHRTLRVVLSNDKISFDGVEGFSIDLKNPELRLSELYDAVFAPIEAPVFLTVEISPEISKVPKAAEYCKDLKSMVESASKAICDSAAFPPV